MSIPTRPHREAPETSATMSTVTFDDLEGRLPLGLLEDDGRVRSYTFNPPRMKIRKQLGALRSRKDLLKAPGRFVSYWLATALATLGEHDLNQINVEKGALLLGRLSFPDVLYLLLAWQRLCEPDGLSLGEGSCHACGHPFGEVLCDLGTLACSELDELESEDGGPYSRLNPPSAVVGLRQGFPIGKGDKAIEVRTVAVKPPSWADCMWPLTQATWINAEVRQALIIKAAICGVDGGDFPVVPMSSIDELWPDDVRRIDQALELVVPTPDLRVRIPCPQCQTVNLEVIDWQDPGFFG